MLFGNDEEMGDEENEWLSFPHKIIHEYIAACYLVREIAKNNEILKQLFPTWKYIKRHEEVYTFCIGCSLDARQASVLISHFCDLLSERMVENVAIGLPQLCHSGIYKIDTIVNKIEEDQGFSDITELAQVFSSVRREASGHKDTCTNPVCNEYIHLYPYCRNMDPTHIGNCKLIIFTETVPSALHLLGAVKNVTDQHKKGKQCLVIFGDNNSEHDVTSISHAVSLCNVINVYMKNCRIENSVNGDNFQNLKNIFTPSLETLCMKHCKLPDAFWDRIGSGFAGSEAMERVRLDDCTGVTEYLLTCIASCTKLTRLRLSKSNMSGEMCRVLCRQLIHLTHLNQVELAKEHVGEHVRHITAAIIAWGPAAPLRRLHLQWCELPTGLVPALLSAVNQYCPLLDSLAINGNNIGGCLSSFMAAAPAYMAHLHVSNCNLQPKDVASITTALIHNRLPGLNSLFIGDNSLTDSVVEPLLQAANTHHQGMLEVDLQLNNLSAELTSRWSSQARPKLHLILQQQYLSDTDQQQYSSDTDQQQYLSDTEYESLLDNIIDSIDRGSDLSIDSITDVVLSKIHETGRKCKHTIDYTANYIYQHTTNRKKIESDGIKMLLNIVQNIDRDSGFSIATISDIIRSKMREAGIRYGKNIDAVAKEIHDNLNEYRLTLDIIQNIDRDSEFSITTITDMLHSKAQETGIQGECDIAYLAKYIYDWLDEDKRVESAYFSGSVKGFET